MHLPFKQRGTECENDNCVRLKLAKNTCVVPGAILRRVYDRAHYVCFICIISVRFYEVLHMRNKVNLTF